jgi:hypothetical protein
MTLLTSAHHSISLVSFGISHWACKLKVPGSNPGRQHFLILVSIFDDT